jgi:hypothetical protein
MTATSPSTFPPYHLLDKWTVAAQGKTRKLERLYHQTQAAAWDPRAVLDEIEKKHGGIHVPEDKREALGHVFAVLLWGELAAWNIAADLARVLPDVEAKMAATGQVFDEARHFRVLRDYLERAKVPLAPLNPFGRRVLARILETESPLQKLYGMQLLVENLALAIFKRLEETRIEPVLTELLTYIERDESRHVALGVLYLPTLLRTTTRAERAKNWAFNMELFSLLIAGGILLDPHFQKVELDHRELGLGSFRLHRQVVRNMAEEEGVSVRELKGVYGISERQHMMLVDFFHPAKERAELSDLHRRALGAVERGVRRAARWWN